MTGTARGRLLVIQPGEKLPTLDGIPGDFAEWARRGMGVPAEDTRVVYPHRDEPLPNPEEFLAVLVTGSSAMVTDAAPWITRGAAWLADVARSGVPLLGICFGHQWLGQALGGRVADNPRGTEVGTVAVDLTEAARNDPLLRGFPACLPLHVSHRQSVISLPPGTVHLASRVLEAHQAFRFADRAWGVQFHPEFRAEVLKGYLEFHAPSIVARGGDPPALLDTVSDSGYGRLLLERFAELAGVGRCRREERGHPPAVT